MKKIIAGITVATIISCTQYIDKQSPEFFSKPPKQCSALAKNLNLEKLVHEQGLEQGVYLFGKPLEETIAKISCKEDLEDLDIPEYMTGPQDWVVLIDKSENLAQIFQQYNDANKLLLEVPIVTGGTLKNYSTGSMKKWPTPTGTYFSNRVVQNPWYYHPQWSKYPGRADKPGKKNPYGTFMMELCKSPSKFTTAFKPYDHSGINFHSTNKWKGPGKFSHGCIRGYPPVAENTIMPAILHNFATGYVKKNGRGIIHKLNKHIKFQIIP